MPRRASAEQCRFDACRNKHKESSPSARVHDGKVTKVGRDVPGPPQEVFPVSPEVCPYLSARDGNFLVMQPKAAEMATGMEGPVCNEAALNCRLIGILYAK